MSASSRSTGWGKGKHRIISAARSLVLYSCPKAEEVIKLAGTVQAYAVTTQIDSEMGPTGRREATPEQRFRVDPHLLRSLLARARHSWSQSDELNWYGRARNPLSERAMAKGRGLFRPKVQVEGMSPSSVTPSKQGGLKQAIDW